ncbi:hypothetical protein Tco_0708531 [Tanacetum coccineum]
MKSESGHPVNAPGNQNNLVILILDGLHMPQHDDELPTEVSIQEACSIKMSETVDEAKLHKVVDEMLSKMLSGRANGSIVSVTKPDYKNLNKNDIEDMYLICINGKVGGSIQVNIISIESFFGADVPFIVPSPIRPRVHPRQPVVPPRSETLPLFYESQYSPFGSSVLAKASSERMKSSTLTIISSAVLGTLSKYRFASLGHLCASMNDEIFMISGIPRMNHVSTIHRSLNAISVSFVFLTILVISVGSLKHALHVEKLVVNYSWSSNHLLMLP